MRRTRPSLPPRPGVDPKKTPIGTAIAIRNNSRGVVSRPNSVEKATSRCIGASSFRQLGAGGACSLISPAGSRFEGGYGLRRLVERRFDARFDLIAGGRIDIEVELLG